MKYQSTRGQVKDLSFEDVILRGYASDLGMFLPMAIPKLSAETLQVWSSLSYVDIVKQVCQLYIEDEIPSDDINALVEQAFASFDDPKNPMPTVQLSSGIILLELFHGKSKSFKDLSMCCATQFIQYLLKIQNRSVTNLMVTSGDTGSAALLNSASLPNFRTIVILPKDRISKVQELQMTTVVGDNVRVVRADGTSDDGDETMRNLFNDEEFCQTYNINSLNSINWCRMMVQIAHHFYAYFEARRCGDGSKETKIFLPNGGLGNGTSACIAQLMGLPAKIVCAGTNDAVFRAVNKGDYSAADVFASLAPAINIQVPYNIERIFCLLSGMDTDLVASMMSQYDCNGQVTIPPELLTKINDAMEAKLISNEELIATIRKCHEENQYTVCPHTAVALSAAYSEKEPDKYNLVVYACASPLKFEEALEEADIGWVGGTLLKELEQKEAKYIDWGADEDWNQLLREVIVDINKN